ncbi:protein phosphatase, Mg2+/Mn2+ dependent, 1Nb (putative) isoform X1 [Scleropages formosus]|uniref:protein phosphatase, Mg2+/Mn2+ dependent, 1Nb (putative) isoform X1 n=1 Tax=Scleropages formosus TaxID=113540 RepID=UPI000878B9EE|nr:protein phosphatase 1A-like isoform X1 [Scleropages formosus]
MRTARKGNVEVPAFVRQLVKGTEKMVSSFFKGSRVVGEEGEAVEEGAIPSPYLERPILEKHTEQGWSKWGIAYALASVQGWRANMEDAHNCIPEMGAELDAWGFFAVYDGHAGNTVAHYCARNLLDHIMATGAIKRVENKEQVKEGIREGFFSIDRHMHAMARSEGWDRGGSTVVAAMISPHRLYIANCGDSRAVLCRDGRVYVQTEDHKPFNPHEMERIQNAGGTVTLQRINGSLAVSRALGDFSYKEAEWRVPTEQMVSPDPDIYEVERSPADEFLLLACDGVWDMIGSEELCSFVRNRLQVCTDLSEVCTQVVDLCLYKGSLDNITVILICFPGAPKVSPAALQQEAELEDLIESKVADIFEDQRARGQEPDLLFVLNCLASATIPGLPPGGDITSKRNCIISAYYKQKEANRPQTVSTLRKAGARLFCTDTCSAMERRGEERRGEQSRGEGKGLLSASGSQWKSDLVRATRHLPQSVARRPNNQQKATNKSKRIKNIATHIYFSLHTLNM